MAMARHRAAARGTAPARLVYSSRALEDVIYREELDELAGRGDGFEVVHTLTRSRPPGWTGYARRIDPEMLAEVAWPPSQHPLSFVCGPTPLVEAGAQGLVEAGEPAGAVKTARFGPAGG